MEACMSRRKKRNRVEVEGLVGYLDDDPIAEAAIITDYGQEIPIDPAGKLRDPFNWMDAVVRVWGRFVMREGRRYLLIDRIQHADGEPMYSIEADEGYDWDGGDGYGDDWESEHEDRY